jgi:cyclohexanone monooxygenase/acetone monooxygenase
MREHGRHVIEPTQQAEDRWVAHRDETASANLISKTTSWYLGSNVPGKPRRVLCYTGGVGTYRQKCNEVAPQAATAASRCTRSSTGNPKQRRSYS